MRKLLVIDDDLMTCKLAAAALMGEYVELVLAHDVRSGMQRFAELTPEIVLLDLGLPDGDGLSVLRQIRERSPQTSVLMMTAHKDIKTAVRAVQMGAADYIVKPFDVDELARRVREELRAFTARDSRQSLDRREAVVAGALICEAPSTQRMREQILAAAASDASVLISGETGAGKSVVARAVALGGPRRAQSYVTVDCKAPPRWVLESELFATGGTALPAGGTIVLEDVGALAAELTARLVQFLDRRRGLDARVIATTATELPASELLFRLAQVKVAVPPLRERLEDLPGLVAQMLAEVAAERGEPARELPVAVFARHAWPGNVRELRNVVRQAAAQLDVTADDLARMVGGNAMAVGSREMRTLRDIGDEAAREAERRAIADTLRMTRGNKSEAARILKTDYKTLHVKMKQLGINGRDYQN